MSDSEFVVDPKIKSLSDQNSRSGFFVGRTGLLRSQETLTNFPKSRLLRRFLPRSPSFA